MFKTTQAGTNFMKKIITAMLTLFVAIAGAISMAPAASAAPFNEDPMGNRNYLRPGCSWDKVAYWVQRCNIHSYSMNKAITVQIQPAMQRGNAGLYLLDGLRATDIRSAWTLDSQAHKKFVRDNLTLVMPVGGQSSFYTDWKTQPTTPANGKPVKYAWNTFLSKELPGYLQQHFGVSPTNNAIVGLSMGGSAAMALAAKNRDQFKLAATFSGYLHTTAKGMYSAIQLAMLDAGGFKIEDMWGAQESEEAKRDDPWVQAEKLRGKALYISSATGIPGQFDRPQDLNQYINTGKGVVLEGLSRASSWDFQNRLNSLGIQARYSFPPQGIHSWPYWDVELNKARPYFLDVMKAHRW